VKEGDKLFELADFSTMWLVFEAYVSDLACLQSGQAVQVTAPAVPGRTFSGKITFIDPNLNAMTRSAKVRVELPNPVVEQGGQTRRLFYHRLYADASVQVELPEVLTVSRSAVLSAGSPPLVYVDKGGGAYEPRRVRLGRAGDEYWEVLDGVSSGESVVTTGNLLIDAQAQLNSSAGSAPGEHVHGAPGPTSSQATPDTNQTRSAADATRPPLTEPQRTAVRAFLTLVAGLADALAADDLAKFNAEAARTHQATPALINSFGQASPWLGLVQQAEPVGHLPAVTDLKAARKQFHPLSDVAVALGQALRRQDATFQSLRIYRCPMTKDSFPGAPRTADWIQFAAPIRNPYFGAEMLDCGSEVK